MLALNNSGALNGSLLEGGVELGEERDTVTPPWMYHMDSFFSVFSNCMSILFNLTFTLKLWKLNHSTLRPTYWDLWMTLLWDVARLSLNDLSMLKWEDRKTQTSADFLRGWHLRVSPFSYVSDSKSCTRALHIPTVRILLYCSTYLFRMINNQTRQRRGINRWIVMRSG